MFLRAFGREYAYRSDWNQSARLFMTVFGMVDLPTRIRARCVRRVLRGEACDRVLDVGAGTGVYSFYFTRQPTCQVVAIDIDANRIATIRQIAEELNREGITAVQGDESLLSTFPENDFSIVLAIETLQYFRNLDQVCYECFRCLHDGGVFVAHVPVRESLWPYERTLFNDGLLMELFQRAGFQEVKTNPTFGRFSEGLCRLGARCMKWPILLAVVYPLLLLLIKLLPAFSRRGHYRLVTGRKPRQDL